MFFRRPQWTYNWRQRVRPIYYEALARCFGRLKPNVAVVLLYHSVNEQANSLAVKPELFARQMAYLKQHFEVVPLTQLLDRQLKHSAYRSRPLAAITFDDGFLDNLTEAAVILKDLDLPATFYVTTGFLGHHSPPEWGPSLPMMSWEQVATLQGLGFDLGAHTLTHPSAFQNETLLLEEIGQDRRLLADHFKVAVDTFAYPRGEFTTEVVAKVKGEGFSSAVTTRLGFVGAHTDPLLVPRIGIGRFCSLPHFRALLSNAFARASWLFWL